MIDPLILIVIFTVFVLFSTYILGKKDTIYAAYFFALFIYSIFTQISYVFFPYMSESINAYYGIEVYYQYYYFVFLSMITMFYVMNYHLSKTPFTKVYYQINHRASYNGVMVFSLMMTVFLTGFTLLFYLSYNSLSYKTLSTGNYQMFTVFLKNNSIMIYMLYAVLRFFSKGRLKFFYLIFFMWSLLVGVTAIQIVGSRTDMITIILGVLFYELYFVNITRRWKKFFIGAGLILTLTILLGNYIESARGDRVNHKWGYIESILWKDYFSPSHVLMTAINYEYIDPVKVISSNTANSLMMMDVPYLQEELGNMMVPGSSDRRRSFAMFAFTEGYIFSGFSGFLYNGIVLSVLFAFWRRFANSNSLYFNAYIYGLIGTQIINLARGQSSYFIKDLYLIFLIPTLFYIFATGVRFVKSRG
jgi:hypothetical protein